MAALRYYAPDFNVLGRDDLWTCDSCGRGYGDKVSGFARDLGEKQLDNLKGSNSLAYLTIFLPFKGDFLDVLQERVGRGRFWCPTCDGETNHSSWGSVKSSTFVNSLHDRNKAAIHNERKAKIAEVKAAARARKKARAARLKVTDANEIPAGYTRGLKGDPTPFKRVKRKTSENKVEAEKKGR